MNIPCPICERPVTRMMWKQRMMLKCSSGYGKRDTAWSPRLLRGVTVELYVTITSHHVSQTRRFHSHLSLCSTFALHTCLKGNSSPHLSDLLLYLSDLALKLCSDHLLLVPAEEEIPLTKIAIDAALDWRIVAAVHEMIPARQR